MAKQVKIRDIAKMAGVSAGTVDRILHNRGNVSPASREAVERVLAETGYKYNIHTSAVSLKKEYKIVIAVPNAVDGEYWGAIRTGIEHAIEEYSDVRLECEFSFYNQFDIFSCKKAFDSVLDRRPNAVIIGPTYLTETKILCDRLDRAGIPFAFVDSVIEGTKPIVSYSSDQNACGGIVGRLMHFISGPDDEFAVFGSVRVGNERSNNSVARMAGFRKYFERSAPGRIIKESKFSVSDLEKAETDILKFVRENPKVRGIAVLNSRGYIVADILRKHGINDVKIVSFDLTANNARCMDNESIVAIICQRPELQGFYSVKSIIRALLYNRQEKTVHHILPIDIVLKENLPYYSEFLDLQ